MPANLLKDDGILVVDNHMNRYSILGLIALFMRTCLGYKDKSLAHPGDKTIIGTMSEREMRKLLKDAGFVIKKTYRFMLLPGYKNYLPLPSGLLVRLECILAYDTWDQFDR